MEDIEKHLGIKAWAEEDRPREKLLLKGKTALSDAELIAILIGSGSRDETAVELSKRILSAASNNLNQLGKMSIVDLQKFKGIGEAKAISIAAALELGRRRKETEAVKRVKITASSVVFENMREVMEDLPHEEFWVLLLNRGNQILERVNISKGGVSQTVVDSKIIFKMAIDKLASSIILCHNHPSGNLKPSDADIQLTKKLKEAGRILDLPILDHLIFADNTYFSFADEGLL
ncbi:RadC family protein [Acidiluteibacter ferrifornacis]|jgi:DNA repair protein RadC|uniref:DNA repair protein RadC n=1 Tax=Acidiluteibacter ferrifornacis TaxID=2692424 RepID=A0A6N9NJJ8_9FLAO|nr:DNA repair protein RadC [Acidiluteibacter ferrifornacis]MBR9831688.1 JAB domain-containing protein [bacterium]NBG66034.1 DNA repair protein RadC [Acidiluteibacter ferrifornacis]